MMPADVNAVLQKRLEYARQNPEPFAGPSGAMGLEVGDTILLTGSFAGWAKREWLETPHLRVTYQETDADLRNYLRAYWGCVWAGGPNPALDRRLQQVAQHRAAEVQYAKDYVQRYGPPPAYRTKTFDNFKAETPKQQAALSAAMDFPYIDPPDYKTKNLNMVLAGPAGVGKTHLIAAMFTDQQEASGATEFTTATALMRKFREKVAKESVLLARYGDGQDSADALDEGCNTLIVDDFGIEADRYASEIFCEILDRRMGADLATVFTTNSTPDELLEWLGERGYSRLLNRCNWVALDGADHRLLSVKAIGADQ
jgi:DNA replication protein DnaC